ncbi:hypothetical protein RZN25_09780 [Bacillaceae bacterium S4-13-56]
MAIYLIDEQSDYTIKDARNKIIKIIELMDEFEPMSKDDFGVLMHKYEWGKLSRTL